MPATSSKASTSARLLHSTLCLRVMALLPPSHPQDNFPLAADQYDLLRTYRLYSVAIPDAIADFDVVSPVPLPNNCHSLLPRYYAVEGQGGRGRLGLRSVSRRRRRLRH